jgi:hypothetical protein
MIIPIEEGCSLFMNIPYANIGKLNKSDHKHTFIANQF